ncbi:MAG: hypothetical protein ABIZ56_09875 [Chthoniobacteraceae bacterium]
MLLAAFSIGQARRPVFVTKLLLTLPATSRTFPSRSSRQRLLSPVGRISLTKLESARSIRIPKSFPDFMAGHHQWFTIKRLRSLPVSKRGVSSGQSAEKIAAAPKPGDVPRASAFARRFSMEIAECHFAARGLRKIESSRDSGGLSEAHAISSERSACPARNAA